MKKVLFLIICFCIGLNIYNAECSYKELKDLNTLASYVETSYKYNEDTKDFTLLINNIPNTLVAIINDQSYEVDNNSITLSGFTFGERVKINIDSSLESPCIYEHLRVINTTFPYMNPYYKDKKCVGHENLEVCSNRFLSYEISYVTFVKLIEDNFKNKIDKAPDEEIQEDLTFWEIAWDYMETFGIPILLVLSTSLITISICSVIYRKVKHGL